MRNAYLVLPLLVLLAACASRPRRGDTFSYRASDPAARAADVTAGDVSTVRMHFDGPACPIKCPGQIREMLSVVDGVRDVVVDVPSRTIVVEVDRGTDPQAVVDAIKEPFRATLL